MEQVNNFKDKYTEDDLKAISADVASKCEKLGIPKPEIAARDNCLFIGLSISDLQKLNKV